MATIYQPILGANTNCGSLVYPEPYRIKAANDRWNPLTFILNDGASPVDIQGMFRVNNDYVGSASILVDWTTALTSTGSVFYRFHYRTVASTQSFDQSGETEAASILVSSPSAVNLYRLTSIPLTSANFSVRQQVEFELIRDPTNAGDTCASAVSLVNLYFGYQTT
jgi:hypothetical protein